MRLEYDEKVLQIIQASCIEQLDENFGITALVEASGELPGNGLIHDKLFIAKGTAKSASSFFCALGWEDYIEDLIEQESNTDAPLARLFDLVSNQISNDGSLLLPELKMSTTQERHGNFLAKKSFRIYRTIFFLRDDNKSEYCGRMSAYLIA